MRAYVEANRVRIRRQKYASARGFKVGHTEDEWQAKVQAFGRACAYCRATDVPLTRDHVVPIGAAPPELVDKIENVVPACQSCNARKAGLNVKGAPRRVPAPERFCPVCGKKMLASDRRYRTCSNDCRSAWSKMNPTTYSPERRAAIAAGIRAARGQ